MSSRSHLNQAVLLITVMVLGVSQLGCGALEEAREKKAKKQQREDFLDSIGSDFNTRNTPEWLKEQNRREREASGTLADTTPPTSNQTEYGLAYALIIGLLFLGLLATCIPRPRKKELFDPNKQKKKRKPGTAH